MLYLDALCQGIFEIDHFMNSDRKHAIRRKCPPTTILIKTITIALLLAPPLTHRSSSHLKIGIDNTVVHSNFKFCRIQIGIGKENQSHITPINHCLWLLKTLQLVGTSHRDRLSVVTRSLIKKYGLIKKNSIEI